MSPNRTILVVDDDDLTRSVIELSLKSADYRVITAKGGNEALELLQSHRADLLLLDLMMPDADGFDVIARVRKMSGCSDLPILVLSARTSEGDTLAALKLGASGYMLKPFRPDELLARVNKALAGN